jgi:hypothetical protein
MSSMSTQCPFSGGSQVEGTPSIAALTASYAVAFSTDPSKRASARPSAAQTALRAGSQKCAIFIRQKVRGLRPALTPDTLHRQKLPV